MVVKQVKTYFKNRILEKKLLKEGKYVEPDLLVPSKSQKNLLIIDNKIPEFDKDSGSRRLHTIIECLVKNNTRVFLLGDYKEYRFNTSYVKYYSAMGVHVYEPALLPDGKLLTKQGFVEKIGKSIDIVWLHRPLVFKKYYQLIKKTNSNAKVVFDMVDFHYIRMKREAELKNNPKLLREAKSFLELELDNCKKADAIIVISKTDQQNLEAFYGQHSKMILISNIHNFIENNADFKDFENRSDLLFVGSFDHQPNTDAVLFLKNDIMPLVWKSHPEIKITIIGSHPTPEILQLNDANFQVLGYVEDLAPFFNTAKLFVAPLRYGAGIKGKIGQCLEYGLPLITTEIGAEGFDFGSIREIAIAGDAADFAVKIVSAYFSKEQWQETSAYSKEILIPFSLANTEKNILSLLH